MEKKKSSKFIYVEKKEKFTFGNTQQNRRYLKYLEQGANRAGFSNQLNKLKYEKLNKVNEEQARLHRNYLKNKTSYNKARYQNYKKKAKKIFEESRDITGIGRNNTTRRSVRKNKKKFTGTINKTPLYDYIENFYINYDEEKSRLMKALDDLGNPQNWPKFVNGEYMHLVNRLREILRIEGDDHEFLKWLNESGEMY